MAAFLPVIEISDAGRQLAETFAATNRLIQVNDSQPAVSDDTIEEYGGLEVLPGGRAIFLAVRVAVARRLRICAPGDWRQFQYR